MRTLGTRSFNVYKGTIYYRIKKYFFIYFPFCFIKILKHFCLPNACLLNRFNEILKRS